MDQPIPSANSPHAARPKSQRTLSPQNFRQQNSIPPPQQPSRSRASLRSNNTSYNEDIVYIVKSPPGPNPVYEYKTGPRNRYGRGDVNMPPKPSRSPPQKQQKWRQLQEQQVPTNPRETRVSRQSPLKSLSAVSVIPPATATLTLSIPDLPENLNGNILTALTSPPKPNIYRGREQRGASKGLENSHELNLNPIKTTVTTTPSPTLSRTVTIPASALTPSIFNAAKSTSSSTSVSSNSNGNNSSTYYNNLNSRNNYKSRNSPNYRNSITGNDDAGVGVGDGGTSGGSNSNNNGGSSNKNKDAAAGLEIFSRFSTLFGFGDRDYALGPIPKGYGLTLLALGGCYSLLRYERNKIQKCKKKPSMTSTRAWFTKLKSIEKEYNLARGDISKTTFLILLGGMGMPYASAVGALFWCAGRLSDFYQAGEDTWDSSNNKRKCRELGSSSMVMSGSGSCEWQSDSEGDIDSDDSSRLKQQRRGGGADKMEPLFCRCGKFLMICGICKLGFDCTRGGINSLVSFH